jgi:hyperosmotically inducible protein
MNGRRWGIAGVVLGIVLTAWIGSGRAQQRGTAEKVGEKIDGALKGVKRGAENLSDDLKGRFERARTSVNDMGLEARIYGRLHWDRALNAARLEVEVRQGGAATLRGVVADEAARIKAVALTKDTVGVAQVVDQLVVSPAATTTSPTPATSPPATTAPAPRP